MHRKLYFYFPQLNLLHRLFIIIFLFARIVSTGQTLGGNSVYNFLKLPSSPLLTAAGGINGSYQANEVGLTSNNPALLNAGMNKQLGVSFNSLPADVKAYSLTGAYHHVQSNTSFGGHIYFVDYSSIPQTDAAGNMMGSFRPSDLVAQLSASRAYLERWNYGASVKFISSNYGLYRSTGLALDVGVHYSDSANGISASVLVKNMGMQLNTYAGDKEDLPFDIQLGITKKLSKAPLGFSVTAQQLHRFNILYNDTAFNNENDLPPGNTFFNKLMNHLVVASHIYLGSHLEATVGYNHLRRRELNIGATGNGLNGFSMGLRVKFNKLQVLYARSNYQRNVSYNQVGITLNMDRLLGSEL
jgi:hypothetical protein